MRRTWSRRPISAGRRRTETDVRSPRAYLTTIVTRLAINQLRAARTKRETYVGPWLPEPLVTEDTPMPWSWRSRSRWRFWCSSSGCRRSSGRCSCCTRCSTSSTPRSPGCVDKTEANCRQLLARARRSGSGAPRARFEADPAQARRLVEKFTEASFAGDMDGLARGAGGGHHALWADGGGKVPGAALKPVHGATSVARFVLGVMRSVVPTGDRRPARARSTDSRASSPT